MNEYHDGVIEAVKRTLENISADELLDHLLELQEKTQSPTVDELIQTFDLDRNSSK